MAAFTVRLQGAPWRAGCGLLRRPAKYHEWYKR